MDVIDRIACGIAFAVMVGLSVRMCLEAFGAGEWARFATHVAGAHLWAFMVVRGVMGFPKWT